MEHLSSEKIIAFIENTLSKEETLEVGTHFLMCEKCRKDMFLAAISRCSDDEHRSSEESSSEERST